MELPNFSLCATLRAGNLLLILAAQDVVFFASTNNAIFKHESNSSTFRRLPISELGGPYAIDVDLEARLIFWTDFHNYQIKRADLDGGNMQIVTFTGSSPRRIAVDPKEKVVYWTDTATDSIEVVKYDGSGRRRLINLGANKDPLGIVVHPTRREIYWANTRVSCRSYYTGICRNLADYRQIQKATCDGSNVETVHQLRLTPNGLALNQAGTKLYWSTFTSSDTYTLETGDIDGNETTTLQNLRSYTRGVGWYDGEVYYATDNGIVGVLHERKRTSRTYNLPTSDGVLDVFVGRRKKIHKDVFRTCSFQRSLCGWDQANASDFDWIRQSGKAAARRGRGPVLDHSIQESRGRYLFVDTSDQTLALSRGDATAIISPPLDMTGSVPKCFRFWYYMTKANSTSLNVLFQANGILDSEPEPPRLMWFTHGTALNEWAGSEVEFPVDAVGRVLVQAVVGESESVEIAIDDVEFGECRKTSRLSCDDDTMTMFLDRARLGISPSDEITLRDTSCRGYVHDNDTIGISTAYDECGTSYYESNDLIIFSNEVTVVASAGIRYTDIALQFNCSLERNYRVEMTYLSHGWIKYVREQDSRDFTVSIRQYPDVRFREPYPDNGTPEQVSEGVEIFIATELTLVQDMMEWVNSRCWATPSANPYGTVQRPLIQNGCPVTDDVAVIDVERNDLKPFSFKVISFADDMELIFSMSKRS
ncbi:uncharacterized protein [Diadema setosum]|uniref:uncharacterized protein n=1 Tax=Diadema setosum TaxID=31175 RepID=UPI003B3B245E